MPPYQSPENKSLEESLYQEGELFDFHQAVTILERLNPAAEPFGASFNPAQEAFKVRSHLSLSVSSSEIKEIRLPKKSETRPSLTVNFLGIAGVQGPLPTPFTEFILNRVRNKDTASRDFLDIFNNRLAGLFHRSQKRAHLGLDQRPPEETPIGKTFLDFAGLDNQFLQNQLNVSDRSLLGVSYLFWQRPHSAHGLQKLICSHYKVPTKVLSFQGHWIQAPSQDITRIGRQGAHQKLGVSTILGSKSWDQHDGLILQIGPLSWRKYCDFQDLPKPFGGLKHKGLLDLTYFYTGVEHTVIIRLIVRRDQIPPLLLNGRSALGKTSWILTGPSSDTLKKDPSVLLKTNRNKILQSSSHL